MTMKKTRPTGKKEMMSKSTKIDVECRAFDFSLYIFHYVHDGALGKFGEHARSVRGARGDR